MAEHNLNTCLALIFDGTGLGSDGKIWGAELLFCNGKDFCRGATFQEVALPGGDQAVRNPIRQAIARLHSAQINPSPELINQLRINQEDAVIWTEQCQKQINAPFTHAAGRLFDSFAALLGLTPEPITYEAQAAIRLEKVAWLHQNKNRGTSLKLPFALKEDGGMLKVDWNESFRMLVKPSICKYDKEELAYAMHVAIAEAAKAMIEYGIERFGQHPLVLSGGVFTNRLLLELMQVPTAKMNSFVPVNDGGIALGQAYIAGR